MYICIYMESHITQSYHITIELLALSLFVIFPRVGVATCLHLHSPQPFSAEAECRCLPSTHHCRLEVLALSVVSAYSPGVSLTWEPFFYNSLLFGKIILSGLE